MKLRVFLLCLICCIPQLAFGKDQYTIAYIEKGEYWLFDYTYDAFKEAMAEKNINVVYPPELHYSPGWDSDDAELTRIAKEVFANEEIDFIVAGGTTVVQALLDNNNYTTPFVGIGIADPIATKLMKTPDSSGVENFTCEVIPERWENMYRVFYDVIGYKKLGIMYPEQNQGRLFSAVEEAYKVAEEMGFEVVEQAIKDESQASCMEGLGKLYEQGMDSFFIGPLNCFDFTATDITPLMDLLNKEYQVPTFARDGSFFVQSGALMGFATWDFSGIGHKLADAAIATFNGEKLGNISLKSILEPQIAINLQTARELGIDLPFDVLVAADELFEVTSQPRIQ